MDGTVPRLVALPLSMNPKVSWAGVTSLVAKPDGVRCTLVRPPPCPSIKRTWRGARGDRLLLRCAYCSSRPFVPGSIMPWTCLEHESTSPSPLPLLFPGANRSFLVPSSLSPPPPLFSFRSLLSSRKVPWRNRKFNIITVLFVKFLLPPPLFFSFPPSRIFSFELDQFPLRTIQENIIIEVRES